MNFLLFRAVVYLICFKFSFKTVYIKICCNIMFNNFTEFIIDFGMYILGIASRILFKQIVIWTQKIIDVFNKILILIYYFFDPDNFISAFI